MAQVLLVEDEYLIAMSAEGILEDAGHEVVHAADGRQALTLLADMNPDLVLTDYMMPRLDGAGLIAAIRGDGRLRDLRIILMTAVPADKIAAMKLPIDAFLQKPFTNEELEQVVARILGKG